MQQRCIFIILTYLFFHQCEDEGFDAQIIPLCPWFWRRRMLAAKNGEALNERTFGWQKSRINWPYPHGERREVMIATLRWAIVCTAAFPHVAGLCVEMKAGEGMAWRDGRWEGAGNSGREILFLAALTYLSAYGTLKVAPFFLRIFSLPYYHSMVELCYLLNPTLFFCSPYKIPMRK